MLVTMATRKNRSRKKRNAKHYECELVVNSSLARSFIGKSDTLPNLFKGNKVHVTVHLSEDEKTVTFCIVSKNRNQMVTVYDKFVDRYNKVICIANNIIKSIHQKTDDE